MKLPWLVMFLLLPACGGAAESRSAAMSPAMGPPPSAGSSSELAPMAEAAPDAPMMNDSAKPAAPPPTQAPLHAPSSNAPQKSATTTPQTGASNKAKDGPAEIQNASRIIYTGNLRMRLDDDRFPQTIDRIIDVAESFGGNLVSRRDDAVEIRVPSEHFRDALTKLEAVGPVVARSVKAEDVSEEFHDLEVRLSNLHATQKRLQDFLARAGNIQDTLAVEHELERVATDIDRMEGRLNFLRARTSFSSIAVAMEAKPKSIAIIPGPATSTDPAVVDLPVDWVGNVGLGPLLSTRSQ